jgi:hypothetical protein
LPWHLAVKLAIVTGLATRQILGVALDDVAKPAQQGCPLGRLLWLQGPLSKALRAAATAVSTSSRVASGTVAQALPEYGLRLSIVRPFDAATDSPLIYIPNDCSPEGCSILSSIVTSRIS